jgi:hypothetical protein
MTRIHKELSFSGVLRAIVTTTLAMGVGCTSETASNTSSGTPPESDAGGSPAEAGSGGNASEAGSGGSSALQWWNTCGNPVCQAPSDGGVDAGLDDDGGRPCPAVGTACSPSGETCGTSNPAFNCGATEVCSATDPTRGVGGCPISSRKFKENVRYVDGAELEQLHEETLSIRLATYNYRARFEDPTTRHLGFIVEDDPGSPAVDRPYDRVDLYGYLSMAIATIQVQEKEIAELRTELDSVRADACLGDTTRN